MKHLGGAPLVHHECDEPLGVDDDPQPALGKIGERLDERDARSGDADRASDAGVNQMLAGDVELHVPEAVNPDHPGADRPRSDHRSMHLEPLQVLRVQARADRLERRPHRQMCGGRREHIASVEGVGHRMEHDAGRRDLVRGLRTTEDGPREGQQTVVRTHQ